MTHQSGWPSASTIDREIACPDTEAHRLLWRSSHNPGVVLVDGEVVGTWKGRKQSNSLKVSVDPWTPLGDDVADVLTTQAGHIAALRGCAQSDIHIGG